MSISDDVHFVVLPSLVGDWWKGGKVFSSAVHRGVETDADVNWIWTVVG